jgi:hypothetical protein
MHYFLNALKMHYKCIPNAFEYVFFAGCSCALNHQLEDQEKELKKN